jgi:hypothetical protein
VLLLAAFALAWVVVLAMASRPSREPEILDWWSVRAAAVWIAAACGLTLLTARLRWLLGPRGTELLEAMLRGLRSSAALWAFSTGTPFVLAGAAFVWLRTMGVSFDTPPLIGLSGGVGLALIFEWLLASAGREQRPSRT